VSKEDLEKIRKEVKKLLDNYLELEKLLQQSNEALTRLVKTEVRAYSDEFQNALNTKLKFYAEAYVDKLKTQGESTLSKSPIEPISIEYISVESSNELRIILETHGIFEQKSWLALWQGNPAACDFAKRLVLKYPPLKGCRIEIYQKIADWLKTVSVKQQIDLIIPKLNDEFNSNKHEMVKQLQQKGLANRVQEVKRPGLACDDSVLVKVQVVSS
jgi:CHAT domain-containing protein